MLLRLIAVVCFLVMLGACSTTGEGTLGSLKSRSVTLDRSAPVEADLDTAIRTYEALMNSGNNADLTVNVLRRLGDLELQRIDMLFENDQGHLVGEENYQRVIKAYQTLLLKFPRYPERQDILYQLARAYEHNLDYPKAIKVLKIYIRDYPSSAQLEEITFRRGELLFQEARYRESELAYAYILERGRGSRFYEQALFKYSWSIYKQDRCLDSFDAFFSILDLKLTRNITPSEMAAMAFVSLSDLELVNDSFRAIGLCVIFHDNVKVLTEYLNKKPVRYYEFLVYDRLAKLYANQERPEGAASAYREYFNRSEWHPYALMLQDKAVDIYTKIAAKDKIIATKKEFIKRYDILSEHLDSSSHNDYAHYLIKSDTVTADALRVFYEKHLIDVARFHHAKAQRTDALTDYKEAIAWYRRYLRDFPVGKDVAEVSFLLAEAQFQDKQFKEAASQYERSAYNYVTHQYSAEAGYAALLAYDEHEKLLKEADKKRWRYKGLKSSLLFAKKFYKDSRAPQVLANAAKELYEDEAYTEAVAAAETVIHRYPNAEHDIRRTALIVLSNTQFEQQNFEIAELFYHELRALIGRDDPLYEEVVERLASCIYKQAESFRSQGAIASAIEEFQRVIATVPNSSIRPIAEYDIASTFIVVDQWEEAIEYLERFLEDYPDHRLASNVKEKIAVAYVRLENPLKAADALEGIAAVSDDPESQRDALWQAAKLYEKGGEPNKAADVYKRYVDAFPSPLEPAVEAMYKAAQIYQAIGEDYSYRVQLGKIYDADRDAGRGSTNRTRYLAAQSIFTLAEPHFERYERVRLVEPIRRNMQLKRQLMKHALAAYNKAAELGVAEFTTAATFRIADMYADFSQKLMDSDRPSELNEEEMEQYEIMLEEQAFPFEEQAIELYETNIERMRGGIYNDWVIESLDALAKLVPANYARNEKYDIPATSAR